MADNHRPVDIPGERPGARATPLRWWALRVAAAAYLLVVAYALFLVGRTMWLRSTAAVEEQAVSGAAEGVPPMPEVARLADGPPDLPEESPELAALDGISPTASVGSPVSATQAVPAFPATVLLKGVPAGRQVRNLSCELQSATDLARYYGKKVTWEQVLAQAGRDAGGNPHKGFVGSLDDTPGQLYPRGYGVYAEPIAHALQVLGLPAEAHYRQGDDWLRAQLAQGRPVMVWVTSRMTPQQVVHWQAKDGTRVRAVRYEHTCLVVGYDAKGVWVIDPWLGQRRYYGWEAFLASWDLLERMAVVIGSGANPPLQER